MYEFFKSALILLLLLAAIAWRRLRMFAVAAYYWSNGGAVRSVLRDGKLCRVWSVPEGELCLCDVLDGKGDVLRTLGRGNSFPDVDVETLDRTAFHGRIMSIEPSPKTMPDITVSRARDFLMERCAGFESTAATAAEVVLLMEAYVGSSYHKRLTIVLPDFSFLEVAGHEHLPIDL